MTFDALRNEVEQKRLWRIHRTVYCIAGAPSTWQRSMLASILASSEGAIASHQAAGRLWKLPLCDQAEVELTVPYGKSRRSKRGLIHATTAPVAIPTVIDGIPTTPVARTLIDLSAVFTVGMLEHALNEAIFRRQVTTKRIRAELLQMGTMGRPRVAGLLALLEQESTEGVEVESPLQRRTIRRLLELGINDFVSEYPIVVNRRMRHLDIAWPHLKLAIEVDGYRFHSDRKRFDDDRRRNNGLALMGWTVLHVTSETTEQELAMLVRRREA